MVPSVLLLSLDNVGDARYIPAVVCFLVLNLLKHRVGVDGLHVDGDDVLLHELLVLLFILVLFLNELCDGDVVSTVAGDVPPHDVLLVPALLDGDVLPSVVVVGELLLVVVHVVVVFLVVLGAPVGNVADGAGLDVT